MDRIIVCIAHDHDWRITLVAAAICVLGLVIALPFVERARATKGALRVRLAHSRKLLPKRPSILRPGRSGGTTLLRIRPPMPGL